MSVTPELPVLRVKIGEGFTRYQTYCYLSGTGRDGSQGVTRPIKCDVCGDEWRSCSRHPAAYPEWVGSKQTCRCWEGRGLDTIAEKCKCGHTHPFDPATVTRDFLLRVGVEVEAVPVP